MKEKQLMKGAAFMLLAATAIPPAHAQLKTNAGVQYLPVSYTHLTLPTT